MKRISLRRLARHLADDLFRLESPLIRTFVELTYRPGLVARNYVNGRRRCYTNPLKYCLLVFAVYGITYLLWAPPLPELEWVESDGPIPPWWIMFADSHESYYLHLEYFMERHGTITSLALLPLLALASKLSFFNRNLNFAEHTVLMLYVQAQITLLTLPFSPYLDENEWALLAVLLIVLVFWLTACQQFFTGSTIAKQLRGLLAAGLMLTVTLVAMFGVAWLVLFYFWRFHGLVPG